MPEALWLEARGLERSELALQAAPWPLELQLEWPEESSTLFVWFSEERCSPREAAMRLEASLSVWIDPAEVALAQQ